MSTVGLPRACFSREWQVISLLGYDLRVGFCTAIRSSSLSSLSFVSSRGYINWGAAFVVDGDFVGDWFTCPLTIGMIPNRSNVPSLNGSIVATCTLTGSRACCYMGSRPGLH